MRGDKFLGWATYVLQYLAVFSPGPILFNFCRSSFRIRCRSFGHHSADHSNSSQSQRRRMNENTLRILQRQWDPSGPLQIKKSSICLFSHGNSGVTVISKKVIAIDHKGRNNLLLTINLQSFITSAGWLHCVCHRHAWAAGRVKREQHWQWVCLIDFSLYKSYVNKCVRFNFNPIKKQ